MSTTYADFAIYAEGLCFASVCTSLTNDEATARMGASGTSHGWQVADQPFASGEANGSPCHDNPTTHRHLLFEC